MRTLKRIVRETDKVLLLICMLLSAFGTLMVTSTTYRKIAEGSWISRDGYVMLLALGLGIGVCLFVSFIDYDFMLKLWPVVAAGCVIVMLLLFPFGSSPQGRDDAISWFKITETLYFQPSEVVKIGFIITFAWHLEKVKRDINSLLNVFLLCVHAGIPIVLVVLSGDLGSALVFMLMFIILMFIAGVHWLYFVSGAAICCAAVPVIWYKVFGTIQRNRFLALIYPDRYPDEIYQQQRAQTAIKAGGLFGQGLFSGKSTQSGAVPEIQNDMIFAAVCEELGFIGAVALILLFMVLIARIVYVGKRSGSFSAFLMCCGVAVMIGGQAIINIGMCTQLLPVIGITLPLISAGGSSVICTYLAIGVVLSVYRYSCVQKTPDDFRYRRISTPFE